MVYKGASTDLNQEIFLWKVPSVSRDILMMRESRGEGKK